MKIGILSSGGDCPGINATIRGVGKTAIMHYGMEVIGIHSGFVGLLNKDVQTFDERSLSGILNLGGTILGTSREKPFRKLLASGESEKPQLIRQNYEELGLDCLVCIGGNGTQKTAGMLSAMGLNVIGVPKTIDNDIWGTDITFGFDTAVNIATEAIDRLHSTASSHKRVMVVEVMGHHAGWIALYAGMAGGADVILLPELGFDMDQINEVILDRARRGKPYSIVVVAEGIETPDKERPSVYVTRVIEEATGIGYSKKESQQSAAKMAIKKLRTDKTFQQFISELKKKKTGESTAENEFENLPEEAVENSGQEIADTEKRKAETSIEAVPAEN